MGILDGTRIVELSDGWTATTLAARLLVELGAKVIKIELPQGDTIRTRPPEGPGAASYAFEVTSAQKHSVCVDPAVYGDTLNALAARSDVVLIEAAQWRLLLAQGLTQEALQQRHPHLIICIISPRGLHEPQHTWEWSELALQASTGMMTTTGFPDDAPLRPGVPIVTHGTAVAATLAVLAALYERQRSGQGQCIDLAGYDVAVSFLGTFLPTYFRHHISPQRDGNRHPLAVPWNAYLASDGWVIICSMGDSAWLRLLDAIDRVDLKTDQRFLTAQGRLQHVDEVDTLLSLWTRQHRVEHIATHLLAAGIPATPIVPVPQFLTGEYCRDRQLRVQVSHANNGSLATLGPLFHLSASPGLITRGAPSLGQDKLETLLATAPRSNPTNLVNNKPLAGVRLIEMGAYTAAPYGTRLLALLGAEVIKVEPLKGDPARHLATPLLDDPPDSYVYHLYNTDKKSITLNTGTPTGRALFDKLLQTSDIFVHNLAYELMVRQGLTYQELRQGHPRLIYAVASGFGQQEAWRQRRAFDTILQAFGGLMDLTGTLEKPPVRVGISLVDLFGGLFVAASILAALHHQRQTGEGQLVDVALGDVAAWLACETWPLALAGGDVSRVGNRHWFTAPHNRYRTRDRDIVLAVEREAHWPALLRLMGRDDLLDELRYITAAQRVAAAQEIDDLVQTWLAQLSSAEALQRCQKAGVPAAPVQEIGELAEEALRNASAALDQRHGHILLGSPFRFSRTPADTAIMTPVLGQHNDAIYGELLGLSDAERAELRSQGVI